MALISCILSCLDLPCFPLSGLYVSAMSGMCSVRLTLPSVQCAMSTEHLTVSAAYLTLSIAHSTVSDAYLTLSIVHSTISSAHLTMSAADLTMQFNCTLYNYYLQIDFDK